jgi:hypothetical protein
LQIIKQSIKLTVFKGFYFSWPIAGVGSIKTKYWREFYFQKQSKNLIKAVSTTKSSVRIRTVYYYLNDKLIKVEQLDSELKNKEDQLLEIYFTNGKYLHSNIPYEYIKGDIQSYLGESIRFLNLSKKIK